MEQGPRGCEGDWTPAHQIGEEGLSLGQRGGVGAGEESVAGRVC